MYPERIACLAAETPDILHELGALDRVVGISAYTTRPAAALALPKVSGFSHGSVERILAVKPDLVILTSSVQRELAVGLGAAGATLLHLHPHSLSDLFHSVELLGNIVGEPARAADLNARMSTEVRRIRQAAQTLPRRPRVYFEEWMDPPIAGVGWVSDIIEYAGGQDIFRERAVKGRRAAERTVTVEEIVAADPELVLASWCGKPFSAAQFTDRAGMRQVAAVRAGRVHELEGEILQCGPGLLPQLRLVHDLVRAAVTD